MKMNWIENLIKKGVVESYKSYYSNDGEHLFVDIKTGKSLLFDHDLAEIQNYAKKNNAILEYIGTYRNEDFTCLQLAYVIK